MCSSELDDPRERILLWWKWYVAQSRVCEMCGGSKFVFWWPPNFGMTGKIVNDRDRLGKVTCRRCGVTKMVDLEVASGARGAKENGEDT